MLRRVALVLRSVLRLLVTANVPRWPIPVILMIETIRSSEISVLKTATTRHIPEPEPISVTYFINSSVCA
jgi:hypothetical protein